MVATNVVMVIMMMMARLVMVKMRILTSIVTAEGVVKVMMGTVRNDGNGDDNDNDNHKKMMLMMNMMIMMILIMMAMITIASMKKDYNNQRVDIYNDNDDNNSTDDQ